MPTLSDIKRRIGSVQSTEQITRAMKMIAAARLRRAQDRMLAMRPYVRELERLIARLLPELTGDEHTLLERRGPVRRVGLLLFTPDRGLCGGLPGNLLRRAEALIAEHAGAGRGVSVFVYGKKGRRAMSRRPDVEVAFTDEGESETPGAGLAEKIAGAAAAAFEEGRIDEAHAVFAEFRSAAAQRVVDRQVIPVEREGLVHDRPRPRAAAARSSDEEPVENGVESETRDAETRHPYAGAELEPDLAGLAEAAIRRHLGAVVYHALLESAASELGARLTAMDAATRNAGDLISRLTLEYNKARQAAITKEILDIVGGVEALR
jgi:F-type H+-transporting ATPase subunit gamma